MSRLEDIIALYDILADLEAKVGGKRMLGECNADTGWPVRGVYFFFEKGENRSTSGGGMRVVRVGTHAVSVGQNTTLWGRLRTHRGSVRTGGGSHRASVFRLLVGGALAERAPPLACPTWGRKGAVVGSDKHAEHGLECAVSNHVGQMPFLWLKVDDPPSRHGMRSNIERNVVPVLSNFSRPKSDLIDPASPDWLGHSCPNDRVRGSGLWNSHYVSEEYQPGFLVCVSEMVDRMPGQAAEDTLTNRLEDTA